MAISERKPDLEVDGSPGYQTRSVEFNPLYFKWSALREIVRWQVFSQEPRELILEGPHSITFISSESFRKARKYFGSERREFLDQIAEEMECSERVILQVPQERK